MLASTVYSATLLLVPAVGATCKSFALEIRTTSPMLAALLFTSPPDLRLVMLLPPRSKLPPVMLMLSPSKCIVVPPLLVIEVMPPRSLFKEYVYVCSPIDWLISCLIVKFLPAA